MRVIEAKWKKKTPEPKKEYSPVPKCKPGCVHSGEWDHETRYCGYVFDTGKLRPCPPGENCTEYECGKRKKEWLYNDL